MIYIEDVGKYKLLVGVKLQKIVKLPRTSNVDAVVKIAPVLLFFLKTYVPATPVVVALINDARVVYTATVVTLGKVMVVDKISNTVRGEEADETA